MAPSLTLISLESTQGRVVEHYSQYHILVTIFAIQNLIFLKILAGFFLKFLNIRFLVAGMSVTSGHMLTLIVKYLWVMNLIYRVLYIYKSVNIR